MMYEGKWIYFEENQVKKPGKTKCYTVFNRESEIPIGDIKWYGPWRQYAFFPEPDTVYERQCLRDITTFVDALMLDRKLKREIQKG